MILLAGLYSQANAFVTGHVEHQQAQGTPNDSALSPDGKYLYTIAENYNVSGAAIEIFSRNAQTGELSPVSIVPGALAQGITLAHGNGIAIAPDGAAVFVTGAVGDGSAFNYVDIAIFWFSRDVATGALTYLGHIKKSDTPATYGSTLTGPFILSNDGKFLYAGTIGGAASIEIFRIESNHSLTYVDSVLKDLNNDFFKGGHLRLYQDANSDSVYATGLEHLGGMIYVFSRDAANGKLTLTQQLSAKVDNLPDIENPLGFAVTHDGKFAYVTTTRANDRGTSSDDEGLIVVFERDSATGTLLYKESVTKNITDPVNGTQTTSTLLHNALVLSNDSGQKFLYSNGFRGAVNVFRRQADGTLQWIGWRYYNDDGNHPRTASHRNMLASSDGRFVYLLGRGSETVAVYDTSAELSIVKTDSVDPVAPSGNYSYTLVVTNNGPSDALSVVVTDPLPAGVAYVSGSVNAPGATCSESGGTVTCNMGNIGNTGVVNATIEVTAPATEGTITNTASVTGDQVDTKTANSSDSEDTSIAAGGGSGSGGGSSSDGGGSVGPGFLLLFGLSYLYRRKRGS